MDPAIAATQTHSHGPRRVWSRLPGAVLCLLLALSVLCGQTQGAQSPAAASRPLGTSNAGVGSGAKGPERRVRRSALKRRAHAKRSAKAGCKRTHSCHKPKRPPKPKSGSGSESGSGGSSNPEAPTNPLQPPFGGSPFPSEAVPGPASPSEPLRLFSAQSVFNEQLPANPPLASNSAAIVSSFTQQVAKYQGKVVVNTTEWSAPVYVVPAGAPTVAMVGESSICSRPEGVFAGFQSQIEAVPIPAAAVPAAGTDKELVIWQPSTGHLWELWRALKESGHWTACWGGEIADATSSDGILPAPFGAGASGLSLLGGQIHLEDLERGSINHALEILLPDTAANTFVAPANRTDGASKAADAIPEGTRLRLSPSLDLSTLHLSAAGLEIATAIQRYGMIVGDTSGSVALSAQDPSPLMREGAANPYSKLLPNPYDTLDAVPWNRLEVVSPSYRG
jgi:hypothetical protein